MLISVEVLSFLRFRGSLRGLGVKVCPYSANRQDWTKDKQSQTKNVGWYMLLLNRESAFRGYLQTTDD
jgi:hypothetical protein